MSSDDDLTVLISATTEEVQVAASVGEEAELPCKTTATVGSITWYVGKVDSETEDDDTKVLSALVDATQQTISLPNFRYDVVTRSLYIRNVSVDQDGYFTCAINAFFTSARVQRKHIRLTVYGEVQLSVSVQGSIRLPGPCKG